ncbi:hypothetical protein QRX60_02705 [Amycolatopsis mongoliensis]|uniref:Uncharacterized protein n=1 Tax=Amycolatopsis mongoliensis TaxID=715475 RepID=A0A9Y2NEJ3_9PSEU|nr:hypothetical protein [Amycolatopsis sp. 4-36]WIY02806.1 hypothetical protein QRX60_02705 [Amycolatopsis sp. 4-36]
MLKVATGNEPDPAVYSRLNDEWQIAYAAYHMAYREAVADPSRWDLAEKVSFAARRVARLWHELSTVPGLEWWALAALAAASEAMSDAAQEWAILAGQPIAEGSAEQTATGLRAVPVQGRRLHPAPIRPRRGRGA